MYYDNHIATSPSVPLSGGQLACGEQGVEQ